MHAVLEDRAARCGRCGTREDEWVREEGGKTVRVKPAPYEAEVRRCPGCGEMHAAEGRFEREGGKIDAANYTSMRRRLR